MPKNSWRKGLKEGNCKTPTETEGGVKPQDSAGSEGRPGSEGGVVSEDLEDGSSEGAGSKDAGSDVERRNF